MLFSVELHDGLQELATFAKHQLAIGNFCPSKNLGDRPNKYGFGEHG